MSEWRDGLEFHHVGVACASIASEAERLAILGYRQEGEVFVDPRQGVRGIFVGGQHPRLELLEPYGESGTLSPWIAAGVKLYHLAYLTGDLHASVERLRAQRGKVVSPPAPAVAFEGREIAFVMLPNRLLVELVTRAPS